MLYRVSDNSLPSKEHISPDISQAIQAKSDRDTLLFLKFLHAFIILKSNVMYTDITCPIDKDLYCDYQFPILSSYYFGWAGVVNSSDYSVWHFYLLTFALLYNLFYKYGGANDLLLVSPLYLTSHPLAPPPNLTGACGLRRASYIVFFRSWRTQSHL